MAYWSLSSIYHFFPIVGTMQIRDHEFGYHGMEVLLNRSDEKWAGIFMG
jgi:hypothetical protein